MDIGNVSPGSLIAVVVMGVSGSGKSSVGAQLALLLDADFIEGDELHPASNIAKMSNGVALDDADRLPWLDKIAARGSAILATGRSVVMSCSALKRTYRDRLRDAVPVHLQFVFLDGTAALLESRLKSRSGHFMPPTLLVSQLDTLELPVGEAGVVTLSIEGDTHSIATQAAMMLRSDALPVRV